MTATTIYPVPEDARTTLGTSKPVVVLAGTAHPRVAAELQQSVRGHDVFIVQPMSPPVNDHLVELLVVVDACRRADADRITAIVPYFAYARADKRAGRRVRVTARAIADMMQSIGIDHVVTLD